MGNAITAPITNQHVDRYFTNTYNASAIDCNGWRESQEDAHTVVESINQHGIMLTGVYDGHGGPQAAIYMKNQIENWFSSIQTAQGTQENIDEITQILLDMDREFLSKTGHPDGCTACIVLGQPWDLVENKPLPRLSAPLSYEQRDTIGIKLLVVNLGDSRAIIVKPNGTTIQCTEDHEPTNPTERQRIINAGGFVENGRVDGSLALSRAIGDRMYKRNEQLPPQRQKVIAVPDFTEFTIQFGDILAVCCDGIYETQYMDPHDVVGNFIHEKRIDILNQYHAIEKASTDAASADGKTESTDADVSTTLNQEGNESAEHLVHLQYLMDPAIISRHLIEQSISYGSRDNHTAIIVSFAPFPAFAPLNTQLNEAMQKVQSLPVQEAIPGLLPAQDRDADRRLFYTDLNVNNAGQYIQSVVNFYHENQNSYDDQDQDERDMVIIDTANFADKNVYSLPPIILHSSAKNQQPIGLQFLQGFLAQSQQQDFGLDGADFSEPF